VSDRERRVAECRRRWELVPDGSLPSTYGYAEAVRRADGSAAVLKVGSADGLAAAEWFSGRGGVRVLAVDRERGALLLERALPGTSLAGIPEQQAAAAFASVARALWRPPSDEQRFPTVAEWGRSLAAGSHAAGVFAELCDSMDDVAVLHGDLHHFNVLRSGDGWVAIDPKGVVGEPAYETGALLRNPKPTLLDEPDPGRILRRRADLLSEALDLDVARVRGWAYAQAVLSAAWSVEDGEDPSFALAVADLLAPLTRGR
jgi:streptomycin 6-kinase